MVEEVEKENLLTWLFEESSSCYPLNTMEYTVERTVKRVYGLGRVVAKVLKDHKILFWSSGGTTLGIVRHGGLIPWDDDLDICIMEQDEHLLEEGPVAKTLEVMGCKVARAKDYS